MRNDRIHWIDIARGIGIIFVVYGHALSAHSYRYLIYSFHMPLFFFLSGIVFHQKKYETIAQSIKRDCKKIILPYFLFAITSLGIWLILHHISWDQLRYQVLTILYGNGNNDYLTFNNILWFLPCLFITKTLFGFILHSTKSNKKILFTLLLFSLIGYFLSLGFPLLKLPFGIETAVTAVVFFGAGYLWNTYQLSRILFIKKSWLFFFVTTLSCIFFATLQFKLSGYQIDMRENRYYDYTLFYIAAFSGILSVLMISSMLMRQTILEYIGRHSLSFFVWHLLLFSYITIFLHFFIDTAILTKVPPFLLSICYVFLSITIIAFLIPVYTYISTFFLGGIRQVSNRFYAMINK